MGDPTVSRMQQRRFGLGTVCGYLTVMELGVLPDYTLLYNFPWDYGLVSG